MRVKTFLLIVLCLIVLPGCFFGSSIDAWQSMAKGTLRSIGSRQLDFKGTQTPESYGTFEEMQADLYIAQGYNLNTMIENYTLTWEAYSSAPVVEESVGEWDSEEGRYVMTDEIEPTGPKEHEPYDMFTVIAYPINTRPGYLCTFAVTEDQVVRVYNPDNGNDHEHVKTWDPIL